MYRFALACVTVALAKTTPEQKGGRPVASRTRPSKHLFGWLLVHRPYSNSEPHCRQDCVTTPDVLRETQVGMPAAKQTEIHFLFVLHPDMRTIVCCGCQLLNS